MPALPPVNKVCKLIVETSDDNDVRSINRFYFQYGGAAPTASQLSTLIGSLASSWATDLAPYYHTSSTCEQMTIEDLTSSTGAGITVAVGSPGTRSGSKLPAGVAVNVAANIARRYRGGKPKSYLCCGVAADLADRQHWVGSFATNVATGLTNFLGGIGGAVWSGGGPITLVNVSYYSGFTNHTYPSGRTKAIPTLRVTPVVDTINYYVGKTTVASQRRRNLVSA